MLVLKAVGKHQWLEGDFDALCAALQEASGDHEPHRILVAGSPNTW